VTTREQFLANVVLLESEAAEHYEHFARRALEAGDVELEAFFSGLAELTRIEANDARISGGPDARANIRLRRLNEFTDHPRSAIKVGGDTLLDLHRVMTQALELKRRCHAYYVSMIALSTDPALRQTAQAFETESAAHLAALEQWIVRLSA
jgi:hypothetical protein